MRKKQPAKCKDCGKRTDEWRRLERGGEQVKLCLPCSGRPAGRTAEDPKLTAVREILANLSPELKRDVERIHQPRGSYDGFRSVFEEGHENGPLTRVLAAVQTRQHPALIQLDDNRLKALISDNAPDSDEGVEFDEEGNPLSVPLSPVVFDALHQLYRVFPPALQRDVERIHQDNEAWAAHDELSGLPAPAMDSKAVERVIAALRAAHPKLKNLALDTLEEMVFQSTPPERIEAARRRRAG